MQDVESSLDFCLIEICISQENLKKKSSDVGYIHTKYPHTKLKFTYKNTNIYIYIYIYTNDFDTESHNPYTIS